MARFDSAVGKYVYVSVNGIEYRVYFEESGKGIPLVCQHTAASDNRQWRYLLNDEEITSKYRVIAVDLPYHGKSLPPQSVEWWKEEYNLTRSFLINFYKEFIRSLGLQKPVYIGCSMGGHLAPDLALECPDDFRAVIGIGASLLPARRALAWWDHPRVSNSYRAAAMLGMTAITSPENNRREVTWEYSQSAPSVFNGDLYYYFVDHFSTLKPEKIDTSRVAVYLLAGEYDPSASPAEVKDMADHVKGSKFVELKGLGHFAMVEDFKAFKKYLMPVLEEIASGNSI